MRAATTSFPNLRVRVAGWLLRPGSAMIELQPVGFDAGPAHLQYPLFNMEVGAGGGCVLEGGRAAGVAQQRCGTPSGAHAEAVGIPGCTEHGKDVQRRQARSMCMCTRCGPQAASRRFTRRSRRPLAPRPCPRTRRRRCSGGSSTPATLPPQLLAPTSWQAPATKCCGQKIAMSASGEQ